MRENLDLKCGFFCMRFSLCFRFGHQDAVTGIDSLLRERAVTCGNDRTVRVWKVVEESQLVFHGHK